ncbi:unnamed protein product [Cuscuta europaea]|nr:unnamed protein product [Cuscuta europaea]
MSSQTTLEAEIASGTVQLMTIQDLLSIEENGKYWVLAKIVAIDNKEWCYVACKRCQKKPAASGNICVPCNCSEMILRYKISVQVMDSTGFTAFVLWDKHCTRLIGKTAADLQDVVAAKNVDGHLEYPEEIGQLLGSLMLFKVQSKGDGNVFKGKKSFSVIDFNNDTEVLSLYSSKDGSNEVVDEFSELRKQIYDNEAIGSSEHEVNSPVPSSSKHNAVVIEDDSVRRSLLEELSVSGPSKKFKSVVKTEKA